MSEEIDDLKKTAGDYKTWALQARKKYIDLRLNNETEIRAFYIRLVQDISNKLKKGGTSQIRRMQLEALIEMLKEQQSKLEGQLTMNLKKYIKANADAATEYAKAIDVKAAQEASTSKVSTSKVRELYFSANQRAIETCWSRTHKGLYLSDRIWTKSKRYRENMTEIIQDAVAEGQDCVKTARMLEKYVKTGKRTLANQYPNMMKRMGSRVPEDICYESLRLARTEMTAAYGEATIQSAMVSPSCSGVKFILSGSHPHYDVCDHICGADEYGLGIGAYPIDKAPAYPFHLNCLCITLTVNENPSDFVDRLKRWDKNPGSEPGLEDWYQNIYKKSSMYIDDIGKVQSDKRIVNNNLKDSKEKSIPDNIKLENKLYDTIKNVSNQLDISKFTNEIKQYYKNGDKRVLMLHEKQMKKLKYSEGDSHYHILGGVSLARPSKMITKRNKLGEGYLGTLFHETGHGEDFLFFKDAVGSLDKYMKNRLPMDSSYYYMKKATKKDKTSLIKLINNGECNDLKEYIMKDGGMNEALSDICVAITKGKLYGTGGHTAKYFKAKGKVQAETFANLTKIYTKGDEETISLIEKYFPNTNEEYLNLVEDMLKGNYAELIKRKNQVLTTKK